MKNAIRAGALALAVVSVILLNGCTKEGPEDREPATEKITETMAGHGREMESQESMEEHMAESGEGGADMEAQHEAMRTLSSEWMKARSSALAGKADEAIGPAKKMSEATAKMDSFMLHKNRDDRQDFLARSHEFKSLVMRFTAYAEQGNTKALREIAPRIDDSCSDCHNAFR